MKNNLKIKEAENSNEVAKSVMLHNEAFKAKRTIEQWVWEYRVNAPERSVFAVACDNEEVIGTQGFIPIYLKVKNKNCLSAKSESSLMKNSHRKGDLFKELYQFGVVKCGDHNISFIWGLTPAVKVWRDKLGFSVYPNVKYTSILILQPKAFLKRVLKSSQNHLTKIILSCSIMPLYLNSRLKINLHTTFSKQTNRLSIEHKLRSNDDLQKLYSRLEEKYDIIHIDQNENFLNWRVNSNPNIKYNKYFVYENGQLRAYCYLNVTKEDAYLTDFTFEDDVAADTLFTAVLADVQSQKPMCLLFTGNVENALISKTFNFLERFGFKKRKDDEAFVILNLSYKNSEYLYNIKHWYINGLWTEGFTW